MKKISIIEKIKNLNLPHGEYVVIGSGILDVLDIRPALDGTATATATFNLYFSTDLC